MLAKIYQGIAWFTVAFLFSSFVEYWMHRFMHSFPRLCKVHAEHHGRNAGQGVLGEFLDYIKGGFLVMCLMFLYSRDAGVAWFLGCLVYAIFAAYAHQLQHENPKVCFWMTMPVHYVHHKYNQWHHNFGLGLDFWDRVFGTYKPVAWLTQAEANLPEQGCLKIRWR